MTTSGLRGLMRTDIGYSDAACSRLMACPLTSRMQCLPCIDTDSNDDYFC